MRDAKFYRNQRGPDNEPPYVRRLQSNFGFELWVVRAQARAPMNSQAHPPTQNSELKTQKPVQSRRQFLASTTLLTLAAATEGCRTLESASGKEQITDIHQHVGYSGRTDDVLLAHQRAMGATKTILLPAGRPVNSAATHDGVSNGLQAKCLGNEACYQLAKAHPKEFLFGANEVPDLPDAIQEIEKYLKLGGVVIGEQKFGVECDSPEMQKVY